MSLTPEQYMALSALAYVNFTSGDEGKLISDPALNLKIENYLDDKNGEIEDGNDSIDSSLGTALATLGDWKLINYIPNTSSGFAAAAFQGPPGPNG